MSAIGIIINGQNDFKIIINSIDIGKDVKNKRWDIPFHSKIVYFLFMICISPSEF